LTVFVTLAGLVRLVAFLARTRWALLGLAGERILVPVVLIAVTLAGLVRFVAFLA